jgi:flagellar assembly protein FliH
MTSSSDRVIRPASLPDLGGRTPARDLLGPAEHAVREGQRIAGALIARATAHAAELRAAAEARGRAEGQRHAFEQESRDLRAAVAALEEAAARLAAARDEMDRRLEAALPGLVVEVAQRILRRELDLRPELLVEMVREGFVAVSPAARIVARVHPDDLACLERHRAALGAGIEGAELRLEPSPDVGRGGCVIETESLTLAAGLPQRIARALELLASEPR